MNIVRENARVSFTLPHSISNSRAIYLSFIVAANRAGIALPRDPVHYDPEQYAHWDFLVRFARRYTLCAGSRSVREHLQELTATAHIYMDSVICEGGT
jgi:hypothetical protein